MELMLAGKESHDQKLVLEGRRRQKKGKRLVIKDKVMITVEELHQGLLEAEAETEAKKTRGQKRKGKKIPLEEDGALDGNSDDENA